MQCLSSPCQSLVMRNDAMEVSPVVLKRSPLHQTDHDNPRVHVPCKCRGSAFLASAHPLPGNRPFWKGPLEPFFVVKTQLHSAILLLQRLGMFQKKSCAFTEPTVQLCVPYCQECSLCACGALRGHANDITRTEAAEPESYGAQAGDSQKLEEHTVIQKPLQTRLAII